MPRESLCQEEILLAHEKILDDNGRETVFLALSHQ